MRKMLLQITWFHKYGEKQTYGYLSPYSVIVKEDEEIYLLDLEAEGSRETVRQIQKPDGAEILLKSRNLQAERNL